MLYHRTFALFMNVVDDIVVHPPSYMEHTAVVGQPYTLPCNTPVIADVRWFFESVHGDWCVYEFGRVREEFMSRFTLNTSVPGLHSLDISNVQLIDTGNYSCIGNNGQGDQHIHRLTVHGKLLWQKVHGANIILF